MNLDLQAQKSPTESPTPSCVSMKSDTSKGRLIDFSNEPGPPHTKTFKRSSKEDMDTPPSPKDSGMLHPGVFCHCCEGNISGIRYKCTVCPDYDLCSGCQSTGLHEEHRLRSIPIPGRELCKVLFPYEAQNEDELSMKEGEIVAIVSKDCADPGWWMGEIGGRRGVFPANFVKMLVPGVEEERPKKPPRPTAPSAKLTTEHRMDDTTSRTSTLRRKWEPTSKRWRKKLEKLANIDDREVFKFGSFVIGKKLEFLIGTGNNGTDVVLGLRADGTEVAVKKMTQRNLEALKNEQKMLILPKLDDPSIVQYVDYAEDENFGYLALQLCEYSLEEYITKHNPSKLERKKLAKQVLKSLRVLHCQNPQILHRDIKPQNVLIDIKGRARLADFGLSRELVEGATTRYTRAAGTTCWMAKETVVERDQGPVPYKKSSDIQVAGMLIYYILSGGHHPFGDDFRCEVNIHDGKYNLDDVQDEAKDLIEWMINADPKTRPTVEDCLAHPFFWSNQRKELQETLCQYTSYTLNDIATVTEFCQSRSEWIDDRTLEKKTMNDIKKEESLIDLSFGHVTGSEDTGQAFVEYVKSKVSMTADARREELNKKLGEVLKETRRGLEKLKPFVDAVESLAVTSLHVFAEKKQVLQLPEGTNFKSVQAVITAAKLVCPLLLQFKREADTFFFPSFHNVDEHTTCLDKYVCKTKLICEMLERSSVREFGNMKNTKTVVQLPAYLSEGDIEEMLRHINLLTDVRMDQNFTTWFMFQDDSSSGFRKEFSDRRLGMLQSLAELNEIAVQLDTMKKGALISSVTGGSVAVVGGVLTIVGGVLTGGASLVLTGVGLGVACGVNSLVTKGTEIAVNKKQKKSANEIMSNFREDLRCLREYIEEVSGKANTTLGKDNVDLLGSIKKANKIKKGIKALIDHVKPETDQGVRGQGGADMGQGGAEIGQGGAEIGQGAAEMGQGAAEMGQGGAEMGQGAAEMGQGAAEMGQGAAEMGQGAAEIGQGAVEIGQGAAEMGQGAAEMGQGAVEIGQGAAEIGQGAAEMGQGAVEIGQGAAEIGQGAAEMGQGAAEMGQGAAEMGQGAVEIGQGAAEIGQGAAEMGQGAVEIGQGAAEIGQGAAEIGQGAAEMGQGAAEMGQGAAEMGQGLAASSTIALNAVGLGLNMMNVCNSISLVTGRRSEVTQLIQARVLLWHSELNSLMEIDYCLRESMRTSAESMRTSAEKKNCLELPFYPENWI